MANTNYLATNPLPYDQIYGRVETGTAAPTTAAKVGDFYNSEILGLSYISASQAGTTTWRNIHGLDTNYAEGLDDFYSFTDTQLWTAAGDGATIAASDANGGILSMATHADNTDTAQIATTKAFLDAKTVGTYAACQLKPSALTSCCVQFGWTDTTDMDGGSANAVFFEYGTDNSEPGSATNWNMCNNVAGTVTHADTGKATSATAYTLLEMAVYGAYNYFYINGLYVGRVDLHETTFAAKPAVNITTLTTAAKTLLVDAVAWRTYRTI